MIVGVVKGSFVQKEKLSTRTDNRAPITGVVLALGLVAAGALFAGPYLALRFMGVWTTEQRLSVSASLALSVLGGFLTVALRARSMAGKLL